VGAKLGKGVEALQERKSLRGGWGRRAWRASASIGLTCNATKGRAAPQPISLFSASRTFS
jgi:hypothetical protein